MSRCRPGIGENYAPCPVCLPPPQLAVDEIREPTKPKANGRDDGQIIEDAKGIQPVGPGEKQDGNDNADKAAVERHAPFPQLHNRQRVGKEFRRIIENHIAKPPANDHAQCCPADEIVHMELCHGRAWAFHHLQQQPPCGQNACNIGKAIPAQRQWAELERDRIKP